MSINLCRTVNQKLKDQNSSIFREEKRKKPKQNHRRKQTSEVINNKKRMCLRYCIRFKDERALILSPASKQSEWRWVVKIRMICETNYIVTNNQWKTAKHYPNLSYLSFLPFIGFTLSLSHTHFLPSFCTLCFACVDRPLALPSSPNLFELLSQLI